MSKFDFESQNGPSFEEAVRQVAKNLYPFGRPTGSVIMDGRERDEVIDTGTELIIVEATKNSKLEKTKYDYEKSHELVKKLRSTERYSSYNFRIILVTSEESSPHQKEYIKNVKKTCPTEILSFSQFYSKLFDARNYLRLRDSHFFGSIRNPADDADTEVNPSDYIPTGLVQRGTGRLTRSKDLSKSALEGGRYVLLGDYGSGKSMTLRDIYIAQRASFLEGTTFRCPIYINLREHAAQPTPQEILYRHSEIIGLQNAQSLIAAWRAGFVTVILDGFDELTPPQFAVSVGNMRHARRLAVNTVFRFFEETPKSSAVFLGGRASYFDTYDEMKDALGIGIKDQIFDLEGFDQSEIEKYLKKKSKLVPDWLPSRPLLLGYLANSGLLIEGEESLLIDPQSGWDYLISRSCAREAKQIWGANSSGDELRLYVERLATAARSTTKGISESQMITAFREIFGRDPDFPARLLTVRLPGLGAPAERETREFIDNDFGDVAASGDVVRFVNSPYEANNHFKELQKALGPLGLSCASHKIANIKAQASIALARSVAVDASSVLSADILNLLILDGSDYNGASLKITGAILDEIQIDAEINLSRIEISESLINKIEFGRGNRDLEAKNYPIFRSCEIGTVEGANGHLDLPQNRFLDNNKVDYFASLSSTNDRVVESNLQDSVKVLITIFRKLFLQSGSGRRYSALKRGLPSHLVPLVDRILPIIIQMQFAQEVTVDRNPVIIPMRRFASRVRKIIAAPNLSDDEILARVKQVKI
jgi:hypothetical protein